MKNTKNMSTMAAKQLAREQNLYLAKLAEKSGRHEDMVEFMQKISASISDTQELTTEERYLLSIAYKNLISTRLASWRKISGLRNRKKSNRLSAIRDYRAKIEADISSIAGGLINLLDTRLIESASTAESKVYYLKMKGDYYRYLAEFKTGDERKDAAYESQAAYIAAQEIANAKMDPAHPIRLGLALNFSVFYYEIMNSVDLACTVAKLAYEEAIEELDPCEESTYRDSISIMHSLRDNIKLWITNLQDDDEDDEDDDEDDDGDEDVKKNSKHGNGTKERVGNSGGS